jgi:hypothetical protein
MGEDVALTLYGVTVNDSHAAHFERPGLQRVAVRDLVALCGRAEYRAVEPSDERVQQYTEVITAMSARGPVLPAPVGVVFRAPESVQRWLELHYVALNDSLTFVENRVACRVHVWRPGDGPDRDAGADLAGAAAESLRTLRRSAVASVPLRVEKATGIVLSAAFLVEQDLWKPFVELVDEEGKRAPTLRLELTGPWAPYDFVQMQLGT